jgi:hypothetical protein
LEIDFLQDFRHLLSKAITLSADSIFLAFSSLLLLVLLVTIFRKKWLAILVFWAVYYLILASFFASSGHWAALFGTGLIAALTIICVARFGLLATVSFHTFFHLSFHNAITADPSRWYFGNTVFTCAVLFGLAIYGFYISLAGQKIFEERLFKE